MSLGGLLYNHIRSEFPGVIKDIEELSLATQKELELLGPSRQITADQRRFLTRIATTYQQEVTNALSGNCDPELIKDSPLKLRMHIRELNDRFASAMARSGHAKIFRTVEGEADKEFARSKSDNQDIYKWIREVYCDSRGSELPGTVNPGVFENKFRQQSSPWKTIATAYIQCITTAVRGFNKEILANIISDSDVRDKLRGRLPHREEESEASANEQLS